MDCVAKHFDEVDAALRFRLKQLGCPEDVKLTSDSLDFSAAALKDPELCAAVAEWRKAWAELFG